MTNETNAEARRSKTDKVKDKVGDAKDTVQETASHLKAEAREKTSELAEEGREKVHELSDRAQHIARTRADEQKDRVTDGIRTFADALRRGCDDLSSDQNRFRPLLTSAADRVEGVSRYLEQRDVDTLASDMRRFAREHTPLFIGGAFALGFAGARFLKSSPDRGREYDSMDYGYQDRTDRMLPESGSMNRGTSGMRTDTSGVGSRSFEGRSGTAGTSGLGASSSGTTGTGGLGASGTGTAGTSGTGTSRDATSGSGTSERGSSSFQDGGAKRGGSYE